MHLIHSVSECLLFAGTCAGTRDVRVEGQPNIYPPGWHETTGEVQGRSGWVGQLASGAESWVGVNKVPTRSHLLARSHLFILITVSVLTCRTFFPPGWGVQFPFETVCQHLKYCHHLHPQWRQLSLGTCCKQGLYLVSMRGASLVTEMITKAFRFHHLLLIILKKCVRTQELQNKYLWIEIFIYLF